mmetsp:Transcript_16246/g.33990  ORF Transcript_16246/g.33990 Transcript_16246/m.33990 type:complete len:85 (-) Transcript_16246:146-400(-)
MVTSYVEMFYRSSENKMISLDLAPVLYHHSSNKDRGWSSWPKGWITGGACIYLSGGRTSTSRLTGLLSKLLSHESGFYSAKIDT